MMTHNVCILLGKYSKLGCKLLDVNLSFILTKFFLTGVTQKMSPNPPKNVAEVLLPWSESQTGASQGFDQESVFFICEL